ncbi:MAG: response regulator [Candidatus Latescibacterota bacterium]|nr:MAG: response regulator [Candidatus Latescibacterota bacterium]
MTISNQAKRILVLDDEPDVVTYLVTLLCDNGYETLSARNGREGMDLIRNKRPDLVTLDISMPGSSGTHVYRELKTDPELADIPVIIVTAVTEDGGDPYAFKDILSSRQHLPAPEGYFLKPIDRDEFLNAIHQLLS